MARSVHDDEENEGSGWKKMEAGDYDEDSLRQVRGQIASGRIVEVAFDASSAKIYVAALENTKGAASVEAVACTANALLATGGKGDRRLGLGFVASGGMDIVLKIFEEGNQISKVLLGCAKIVHVIFATTEYDDHHWIEPLACTLYWALDMECYALAFEILAASYALSIKDPLTILENNLFLSILSSILLRPCESTLIIDLQVAVLRILMLTPEVKLLSNLSQLFQAKAEEDGNDDSTGELKDARLLSLARRLLFILKFQLWRYLIETDRSLNPDRDIVPPLDLARKLLQLQPDLVRIIIFPPQADSAYQLLLSKRNIDTSVNKGDENIHPADAPPYTLRSLLFQLQTDINANVKRFANELLFDLCHRDPKEFSLRCGIGNALAYLQAQKLTQTFT